jgi:ligand-binding sensor domain-containing protein
MPGLSQGQRHRFCQSQTNKTCQILIPAALCCRLHQFCSLAPLAKAATITLLAILLAWAVQAQQRFINFSAKDGLPEKYIYTATQDAKGFMWFGTGTGLYRYDGHQFKLFRSPLDRPGANIANILQTVATDSSGHLWLGSVNAFQWYRPATNHFWAPNANMPVVQALCAAYINGFTPTWGGMFISSNSNFFFSFKTADSSFAHWGPLYPPMASKTCLKVIARGTDIWAVHAEGIYRFAAGYRYTGFFAWPGGDITAAQYDAIANDIVFTTWENGLQRFNTPSLRFKTPKGNKVPLYKNILFTLMVKPNGNIWVGGYQLWCLDSNNVVLHNYFDSKENIHNLNVSKIGFFFNDREDNMWICSHYGLAMMPWQNNQIKGRALVDRVSKNVVEPAAPAVNLRGTDELLIANTCTAGLMHYDAATDSLSTIVNPLQKGAVAQTRIHSLVQGGDGGIYAGDDVHFYRYEPATKQLMPFPLKDQHGRPITAIGRSVYDNRGNVFIGSKTNGLYIWHQPSGKLTHYGRLDIDKNADAETGNLYRPCLVDKAGNVWLGTKNGVYEYRSAAGKFYHHAFKPADKTMPVPTVLGMAQDKTGHYWIASASSGLYELYFDNGREVLRNYTQNSNMGLPTDYLYHIETDPNDGCLWINGHVGLMKFDPYAKRMLTLFNQQQGLAQNDGGYFFSILPNKKLAHLYYGFVNLIDLGKYRFNSQKPELVFSSAKVLDKERVYQLDETAPQLDLAHNENFLQLEFTALCFNNGNLNQYAYQLEGIDKDWVYCGNRNQASYNGLRPGKYVFKAKAANNDGVWGEVKLLHIVIKPPFYATWWFVLLMALLLAGLVYWWNRSRIRQVKKEEKLKSDFRQRIAETEMKALRAQMNPHFIFNCLNSIQKYILQQDHFAASQYLTRFSRLIRLILDHSNQNMIALSSELDLLRLYVEMEQLRFSNQFGFEVVLDPGIDPGQVAIPSMLIQPYLENAIWHGLLHKEDRGSLLLRIARSGANALQVVVQDNGVGRAMARELKSKQVLKKKSYGMQITEDRIAIINRTQGIHATCTVEDLTDNEGRAAGTRVVLHIPFKATVHNQHDNDDSNIDR